MSLTSLLAVSSGCHQPDAYQMILRRLRSCMETSPSGGTATRSLSGADPTELRVRRQAQQQDDPCDSAATDEDQPARARRQLRPADATHDRKESTRYPTAPTAGSSLHPPRPARLRRN